jgi:hypothetical protein
MFVKIVYKLDSLIVIAIKSTNLIKVVGSNPISIWQITYWCLVFNSKVFFCIKNKFNFLNYPRFRTYLIVTIQSLHINLNKNAQQF